ncbi:MAG: glycosyltransferase family 39 protein [Anaerolineae bacterium]
MRLAFVVLVVVYLALSVAYSLASPIYEPTDELRHVRYVRHILTYRSLPLQRAGEPRAQSHHPPLYYALGALAARWVDVEKDVYYQPQGNPFWAYRYWEVSSDNKNQYVHRSDESFPFKGVALVVYVVRWMTVLIGAGTVWLTYRVAQEVFPTQPALALGGAALVAFNPQFLHLSGAVSNDVPAALCGAAVLLLCVRLVREGPSVRADMMLGGLLGLSLLTKFHLLALLAPILVAYLVSTWPTRNWRAFIRGAVTILGLTAILSGWWFLRNWQLYGDPTGLNKLNQLWAGRSAGGNWWVIRQKLPYLWSSLWGRFGYGQVPLPKIIYRGLLVFCLVALTGYLLSGRRRFASAGTLLPLITAAVVFVAVVTYYMLIQPAGAMGRFLFPVLPAFGVLLIGGLSRYLPVRYAHRLVWIAGGTVTVMMASLAVYALVGVLVPAFAAPRPLREAEIKSIPNQIDVRFGSTARLLGYRVTPEEVEPGDTMGVTLYWQPLARTEHDYAVFVHLMSDVGVMITQRDTYPGMGRYPTTTWDPGVVFADTYRVQIPETAYAPDRGYVQVGLYLPDGPRLATEEGQDVVQLTRIKVDPRLGEVPNALEINFEDKLALKGYALGPRVAEPGETVRLTLYWQALTSMEVNYNVFAHVLGEENQIWANSDSPLTDEGVGTNRWKPGTVVKEVRELMLVEATPPDFYDIELGLRVPGQGRLKILAEDGRALGNRTLLTTVRVVKNHE